MFEFFRANQLNVMLLLCGGCGILVFLLLNTRFISGSRKWILILMETVSFFLLWFDRLAYVYAGVPGEKAYIMVRVSNFIVFFLTSAIVFCLNLYIVNLMKNEGKLTKLPSRLTVIGAMAVLGMIMSVIAAFTDLYYYFDEANLYHRGHGFLIAYIIPVVGPILQFTVVRSYKKVFSRLIYISLVLFIFVPLICGILQIFTYGISIVNMAMVAVSISLYILMYLDLNNTVEHAHEIEIENMQGEKKKMQRLFSQTATAFVSAVEKKDDFTKGKALKIADYAKRVAKLCGKDDEECEKVYYAALLHDVGLIGIPDEVIKKDTDPDQRNTEVFQQKPLISMEILSSITEYPYLSDGAHYSHERYNGTGYPEGLKGEEIPEIARIIAVADTYVTMVTKQRYRDARPVFEAREAFVKGAGEQFDPVFADCMVKIIDADSRENEKENALSLEKEIVCKNYREQVTTGIPVEQAIKKISFKCEKVKDPTNGFSAPSIVLFDSYDGRIHNNEKAVQGYHYLEYGEIWFDKFSICSGALKMKEKILKDAPGDIRDDDYYEIIAGRYEDHLRIIMKKASYSKEVIIALSGGSQASYIGITGENCRITDITAEPTGENIHAGEILRLTVPVSYIDHLESDVPNVQIDTWRSASTKGIEITRKLKISFHTMSLPGANLVWHCPYVVIFTSKDGSLGGEDYREYEQIKLNGEDEGDVEFAQNRFVMKRKPDFPGWDTWKQTNKEGMECDIYLEKRGRQISFSTENLGISIENTTTIKEDAGKVYVALTGDEVALTDIRIEKYTATE